MSWIDMDQAEREAHLTEYTGSFCFQYAVVQNGIILAGTGLKSDADRLANMLKNEYPWLVIEIYTRHRVSDPITNQVTQSFRRK